jgi:hypothetical protein
MRRRWIPWAVIALLAACCCVLAILQYTWLTQFASAQREQLKQDLQTRLNLMGRSFNDEISNSVAALVATEARIDELGRERAYAFNSYSNYQTLARAESTPRVSRPATPTVFYRAAYEPAVVRRSSNPVIHELMHGLRLNLSLTIFLLFAVAISVNERAK